MKSLLAAVLLVCAFFAGAYVDHVGSGADWQSAMSAAPQYRADRTGDPEMRDPAGPDIVAPAGAYSATPTPSRIIPVLPLSAWAGRVPAYTASSAAPPVLPAPPAASRLPAGRDCLSDLLGRGLSYTESSHVCGVLASGRAR